MQFSSLEVVKTKENYHYLEWDMSPGQSEAISDYKFQIWWSNDPVSGFLPVTYEPSPSPSESPSESSSESPSLSSSASESPSLSPTPSDSPSESPSESSSVSPSASYSPSASESPSESSSESPSASESPSPSPSEAEEFSIVEIDGAVGPLVYTHQLRQYNFNKKYYYKILAIEKAYETNQFFSNTVFIGMYSNGVHETMRHAENVLYRHYHGEPCYIVKRKSFGERCPECWSPTRKQCIKTHCDTCNGTGFTTGYYQKIDIQISFDSDPKKVDSQKDWENVFDTKRARLSNYPIVRSKDLIVNKDDYKRYVVTHVETTKLPKLSESTEVLSKQNYILSQLLTLEELNPDDNEYFLDVDNIPEIPLADEGRTGDGPAYFNDHNAATGEAPINVTTDQLVSLGYDLDQFEVVNDKLTLKNGVGNLGLYNFRSAEVIFAYRVVSVDPGGSGEIILSNVTDQSHVDRVVGIATIDAGAGGIVPVRKLGIMENDDWDWEVGKGIFFDENGVLTQTVPLSGFWMNVAKAITSTKIEVLLRLPVIRVE